MYFKHTNIINEVCMKKNKIKSISKNNKTKIVKHKKEIGGQKGPEPTRYGDWEKNGRVTDF